MYRVVVLRAPSRSIERLPRSVADNVTRRILAFVENPPPQGAKPLRGFRAFRLRVGDYRVIYEVDDGERIVTVRDVGHRQEVYRGALTRLGPAYGIEGFPEPKSRTEGNGMARRTRTRLDSGAGGGDRTRTPARSGGF